MVSPKLIVDIVAKHFGLTRQELLGRRRLPRIVLARHVAQLLTLEMVPHASLKGVGRWFGGPITRPCCTPAKRCAARSLSIVGLPSRSKTCAGSSARPVDHRGGRI